jgi:hypothetical protein
MVKQTTNRVLTELDNLTKNIENKFKQYVLNLTRDDLEKMSFDELNELWSLIYSDNTCYAKKRNTVIYTIFL